MSLKNIRFLRILFLRYNVLVMQYPEAMLQSHSFSKIFLVIPFSLKLFWLSSQ
jgi:hypothetical protein